MKVTARITNIKGILNHNYQTYEQVHLAEVTLYNGWIENIQEEK